MEYQTIKISTIKDPSQKSVLYVSLNRPESYNALNKKMIEELLICFQQELTAPEIRLVILKGIGLSFCAGADLTWMHGSHKLTFYENLAETSLLTRLFQVMHGFPKPILAVAHGAIRGGGLGLLACADIVIADINTSFALSETRLGITPACISPFLTVKIGLSTLRALCLTGRVFSTTDALRFGLIHDIGNTSWEVDQKVQQWSQDVLACGPHATGEAKKLLLHLAHTPHLQSQECLDYVSLALARLRISSEAQEGMRAFLEKRSPSWL